MISTAPPSIALNHYPSRIPLSTRSVVDETDYFEPAESNDIWELLFPPAKRSLKPVAKHRKAEIKQVSNCDLLIQIVGGKNVPVRRDILISSTLNNTTQEVQETMEE